MTCIRATLIGFVFVAIFAGQELFACSCGRLSREEAFEKYPLIFTGTVERVEDQFGIIRKGWALLNRVFGRDPGAEDYESYYGLRITFRTQRVWKGLNRERIVILTGRGGGDCGLEHTAGAQYLVYASGQPLRSGLCSRTSPIEMAGDDLTYLAGVTKPPL